MGSFPALKLDLDGVRHKFQHGTTAGIDAGADNASDQHIAGHRGTAASGNLIGVPGLLRLTIVFCNKNIQFRFTWDLESA